MQIANQNICDRACENRAYLHMNFAFFLNFDLMILDTYLCYHNETFRTYSKIHKELLTEVVYHT